MKQIAKEALFSFVLLIMAVGGLFFFIWFELMPPTEAELVANFTRHRASFEKLKDMLIEDRDVQRVAKWGVDTNQHGVFIPPKEDFSTDRYNQYLALLKEAGGVMALRFDHQYPSIGMWARGFGGETQHIWIGWIEEEPTNLVDSLDDHQKHKDGKQGIVYRHLDGNWYLYTDL